MLCSQTVWLRLTADLKSRRSSVEILSDNLKEPLRLRHPQLLQKVQRLLEFVRTSKPAFQLLVERAGVVKEMDDVDVQALFAHADFSDAARVYDASRLSISHELQLWEVAESDKRDAFVGMALSLFRQCEAIKEAQERALALCQIQLWTIDGVLHYAGEPETEDASNEESQS